MNMTREDIVTSLKDQARDKDNLAGGDPDSIFAHDAAALWAAADALRAQHDVKGVEINQFKPSKLDRSRWEGCEYCIGDNPKSIGTFEIYDDIEIPEGAIKFKWVKALQYCPICGKPLSEEAWAELERRIERCLT